MADANAFSNSVTHANRALKDWGEIYAFLQAARGQDGKGFNLDAEMPGTGQRLGWLDKHAKGLLGAISLLAEIDAELIPLGHVTALDNTLQNLNKVLQTVIKEIELANTDGIQSIDLNNWALGTMKGAGINFASHLQQIKQHIEIVHKGYYDLAIIIHAGKFSTFLTATSEIEKELGNVRQDAKAVAKDQKGIEGIHEHAKSLLGETTNASLVGVFRENHENFERQLFLARIYFYASLGLVFILAILIALPALYDLVTFSNTGGNNGTALSIAIDDEGIHLSGKFVLFLLIFPAIWLARFSAARHHQLFLLKEDYLHKYSLAMAVEGFKKQSEKYEQEIVYATLTHLLFNPADRLAGKRNKVDDGNPNRFLTWLMNKMGLNAEGKADVPEKENGQDKKDGQQQK